MRSKFPCHRRDSGSAGDYPKLHTTGYRPARERMLEFHKAVSKAFQLSTCAMRQFVMPRPRKADLSRLSLGKRAAEEKKNAILQNPIEPRVPKHYCSMS